VYDRKVDDIDVNMSVEIFYYWLELLPSISSHHVRELLVVVLGVLAVLLVLLESSVDELGEVLRNTLARCLIVLLECLEENLQEYPSQ
jgi:hypothetical protein